MSYQASESTAPATSLWKVEGEPDARAALFMDLADAQAELTNLGRTREVEIKGKTKKGADFKYTFTYTPLDDIIEEARRVLPKHDLAFSQMALGMPKGAVCVVTVIGHGGSGAYMECVTTLPCPVRDPEPKDVGSLITYAKRYALGAIIGIASEEDNDGKVSGRGGRKGEGDENGEQPGSRRVDPRIGNMLNAYGKELGVDRDQLELYVREKLEKESFADMGDDELLHMRELYDQLLDNADREAAIAELFGKGAAARMEEAQGEGHLFDEDPTNNPD